MIHRVNAQSGDGSFPRTGKIAKQADGAVARVRYGDTLVLVTACSNKEPCANADFFL
jgi:polyribonucleotide nucleotidyltransferase